MGSGIDRLFSLRLGRAQDFHQPIGWPCCFNSGILPESRRSMQQLHVDGPNPINWSKERLIHWRHHLSVLNCGHWRQDGGNLPCQVASEDSSEFLGNTLDKFGLRSWMSVCGYELSSYTSNDPFNLQAESIERDQNSHERPAVWEINKFLKNCSHISGSCKGGSTTCWGMDSLLYPPLP